jgi:membrane associated rhomboid family serine protease
MAICAAAFVPQLLDLTGHPELQYSLYGPAVASGEWWRVLTAQVEHHGFLHLAVNGTSILGFAPFIERRIGGVRLAVASAIAGLFSAAFALYFSWAGYTAGASGMIIGWLGLGLLIVEARWRRVLLQWAVFNVIVSLAPGVSWAGHLGGFVGGLGCGALIRKSDVTVPPTRFDLFDRFAPVLIALGVMAVWVAIQFHLPGASFPR